MELTRGLYHLVINFWLFFNQKVCGQMLCAHVLHRVNVSQFLFEGPAELE
jgi:hypothetical protein